MVGATIGHYRIVQELGRGGMGTVYKALDTHLNRLVAIKVLTPKQATSEESRRRFTQEAQSASALNHPNIVTIHDIASESGSDYIVMEFVAGKTLDQTIAAGRLSESQALLYATQIAGALARAHEAGIVHRDLKPSNIMIADDESVKLLDFGLAKLAAPVVVEGATETIGESLTLEGHIVGTLAYMSPEQAQGKQVDARSDIFSFGAVMYEMLSGRRPFDGGSQLGTLMAIVKDPPPPLGTIRQDLSPELIGMISRCLAKQREDRYSSGVELYRELDRLRQRISSGTHRLQVRLHQMTHRPRYLVPALAVLFLLVAFAAWGWNRLSRVRWAQREAIPRIAVLAGQGKYVAAFDLAREAQRLIPDDARLKALWPDIARTVSVRTEPPGAQIYFKAYDEPDSSWRQAGISPANMEVPRGHYRWKMEKAGYLPLLELAPSSLEVLEYKLSPKTDTPPEMVHVPYATPTAGGMPIMGLGVLQFAHMPAFWIDRTEVTNREFKRFVDAGGYSKKEYWKHAFHQGARTLSWEEAMREFRDGTGRPGPVTWEAGSFRTGEEEQPVRGVSWYEAAAYAEFAGKQLPSIYHWYRAADPRSAVWVMPLSNFKGSGPAPVGQFLGTGPFGTVDMAGNVKEWCFNESNDGTRFLLGGAWHEPQYTFYQANAVSPFDRSPSNGFRCVRYGEPAAPAMFAARPRPSRARREPASEESFRAYVRLYAYDPADLKQTVERVDSDHAEWIREKVSFQAAYRGERVIGYLLRPKGGKPPFQTIVYHPGAGVQRIPTSVNLDGVTKWDYLVRGGRAVFCPVLIGTYERQKPSSANPVEQLAALVERVQDVQRSVDYLLTRADVDPQRLAYMGSSWGAGSGAWILAVERRFKAAVLNDGGLFLPPPLPQMDQVSYAPRVQTPVLMLNGRYDFFFPLEESQKPMFRLLGTPAADKRHVLFESAHDTGLFRQQVMKETLDWLEKYLGPVGR